MFPLHGLRPDGTCSCAPADWRDPQTGSQCRKNNPGKHPASARGFQDATCDRETIFRWLAEAGDEPRNVGTPVPAGWAVVDIDPRNGGTETFEQIEAEHGKAPPTLVQRTGSGGYHLWYRLDDHAPLLPGKLTPSDDRKAGGVDTRNGGRSYVVVEPSAHTSGNQYQWLNRGATPAPAPSWLKAKAFAAEDRSLSEAAELNSAPAFEPAEHDRLAGLLAPHWIEGVKHNLAKAVGGWLRQRGGTAADVRQVIARLPSNDPEGRISGAIACWAADSANGWHELCNLIGEPEAAQLDQATPNHVYSGYTDWPEVWELVRWPDPKKPPELAELPEAAPDDPWFGLPHPVEPDTELRKLDRLVEGIDLVPGAPCALIGLAHSAKTPMALRLGLSVATGKPFLDRPVQRRRVIYLVFEKWRTADRRRVRIARSMGVDPAALEMLPMTKLSLANRQVTDRLAMVAAQEPALFIFDTYNSSVLGLDHNAPEFAGPLHYLADKLCEQGAAVLTLFHCRKGEGRPDLQDIAGHNAVAGMLDAAISLHRETDDMARITVSCARAIESDFAPFDVIWQDIAAPPVDDSLGAQCTADPAWGLDVAMFEDEKLEAKPDDKVKLTPAEAELESAIARIKTVFVGDNVQRRHDGTVAQSTLRTMLRSVRPLVFEAAVRRLRQDGYLTRHRDGDTYCYALAAAADQPNFLMAPGAPSATTKAKD